MASASSSSLSIYSPSLALAFARSNNNNKPRKQLSSKTPNTTKSHITSSPPLSSVSGGQATTYTRLPPKDDAYLFLSPSQSFTEIQLSDVITTTLIHKHNISSSSKDTLENDEDSSSDEVVELDAFDYGNFELFEVHSDGESGAEAEECDEVDLGYENGEEDEREKEKGVPAVMRCFDRAKIYVRSGDGGNGVMAFRREKFVPLGGPSGGDGGRGGNVYMEVDAAMNSLLPFRNSIHFRAGRGGHGQGSKMNGAKGEDVIVKVPPGTVVRAAGKDGIQGNVLLELLHPGDRALLLPGGRGGRGNASFKSGSNKVPRIAENGEEGPEM